MKRSIGLASLSVKAGGVWLELLIVKIRRLRTLLELPGSWTLAMG